MEVAIKDIFSGPATNTFTPPPFALLPPDFEASNEIEAYISTLTDSLTHLFA